MSHDHDEKDAKGELLPCPFCGSGAQMQDASGRRPTFYVDCDSCGVCCNGSPSEAEARAAWNTRADTARIVAEAVADALKCTTAMAVALEQEMDNQLRASGMDANHVHRQDGFDLWAAAIRARSTQPDAGEKPASRPLTRCAAGSDGDCSHSQCPQMRDGEPLATGRHCPIDRSER